MHSAAQRNAIPEANGRKTVAKGDEEQSQTVTYRILEGDCLEQMAVMPPASVDAVVCDPPYGLEFMGKEWDRLTADLPRHGQGGSLNEPDPGPWGRRQRVNYGGAQNRLKRCRVCGKREFSGSPCRCPTPDWEIETPQRAPSSMVRMQRWHEAWAREALRVLKPGGHLLAMGGPRTIHRLVCAIEDSGFEIRDMISWNYGSGFPKSLNVSRALQDRVPAHERCACAQRSTRTAQGSPTDCPADSRSDDGRPHRVEGDDLSVPPSPVDARERSRDDRHKDDPAAALTSSGPGGESDHPATEGSAPLPVTPSIDSLALGSTPSDRASSTSPDEPTAERRTASRTPDRSRSDAASSDRGSPLRNTNLPRCPDCSGVMIPEGFGTALKPAWEGITVARKPLTGTVAQTVLEHGTGALNVDGCRITTDPDDPNHRPGVTETYDAEPTSMFGNTSQRRGELASGRWPANVVLNPEAAELLDAQTGNVGSFLPPGKDYAAGENGAVFSAATPHRAFGYGDSGGASRFFYVAKSSRAERNAGLDGFEATGRTDDGYGSIQTPKLDRAAPRENWTPHEVRNSHPTVKPIALMRWLVRLVTPPGGTVLDPFTGSGTTGIAAILEGFDFIGIEREPEYVAIARARIAHWAAQPVQLGLEAA